jgi:hypothetical protein
MKIVREERSFPPLGWTQQYAERRGKGEHIFLSRK